MVEKQNVEWKSSWSVETLMKRHRSLPHNPLIANGFFRAGYVETWGHGIEKICEACEKHGVPLPEYVLHPEDIMMTFRTNESQSLTKAPKPQGEALEEALKIYWS